MTAYDAIADWYDSWVGALPFVADPFWRALETLIGPVRGLRICDLACGQGRVARYLAERGASVVGVDSSARLLEIARAYAAERPQEITYVLDDARRLSALPDADFDGVVCFMSLMDIADLEPTLHTVRRVLRAGGWFGFAVLHPCFNPPGSGELRGPDGRLVRTTAHYFDEGHWQAANRTGPPAKVGSYHRTLSTYLNALVASGFRVDALAEPPATGRQAELRPIWTEVPAVLVVRCSAV